MEQPQAKKKMSTGCVVALVIVAVVVVVIIIGGITCYVFRGDIAKEGAVLILRDVQNKVHENPPEDVDTAQFNAIANEFLTKLDQEDVSETGARMNEFTTFLGSLQTVARSDSLTTEDIQTLQEGMVNFYPELAEIKGSKPAVDTLPMPDSVLSE